MADEITPPRMIIPDGRGEWLEVTSVETPPGNIVPPEKWHEALYGADPKPNRPWWKFW